MQFRYIIALYSESNMEHMEQNADLLTPKQAVYIVITVI
jgi:hypothetical protein